jgi:CelD/BcsL family acetyltransferase involved in cellulose biosynthesis
MNWTGILRVENDYIDAQLFPIAQLPTEYRAVWSDFQTRSYETRDAFFSLDFAEAAEKTLGGIHVIVLKNSDTIIGFLPLEINRKVGAPVASIVSEIQGAITSPQASWNMESVLKQVGLSEWRFDCVPSIQAPFYQWRHCEDDFSYVCMKDGIDGLRTNLRKRGGNFLVQMARKTRKFEREFGPLEFQFCAADREAVLDCLAEWKSQQYRRTGTLDVFAFSGVKALVSEISKLDSEGLKGIFSVLRYDGELLAVHFGMKGFDTLNCWFPAYNPKPEFARHSVGQILLLKILQGANENGINRYHFGRGDETYKLRLQTGSYPIVEGSVNTSHTFHQLRKARYHLRETVSNSRTLAYPMSCMRKGKQFLALRRDIRATAANNANQRRIQQ